MHRGITLLFSLTVAAALNAAAAAGPAAEVVSVEGKGEYREAQQTTWRPASVKHPLFPTNYVRTLDMSRMAIVFVDRTQVRLVQNSMLQYRDRDPREPLLIQTIRSGGYIFSPEVKPA